MKKNKNEAVKNSSTKPEDNKKAISGNSIPSEKAQINNDIIGELPFKKVIYGYNPEEVSAFIDELTKTHETSSKLHESKLSSLKEELALSNRERDYYKEKCKNNQARITETDNSRENKNAEYESLIYKLQEKIKTLENENIHLKNAPPSVNEELKDTYLEKIDELKTVNRELEDALNQIKTENEQLKNRLSKFDTLFDEHRKIQIQYEETKHRLSSTEKELDSRKNEILELSEKITDLIAEKEENEKKISDLELQNDVLTRQANESDNELLALKQANQAIVLENAEKIKALESECATIRLNFRKEMKLYSYYIDRAELTVAELTKQMEQIKQSTENSEL